MSIPPLPVVLIKLQCSEPFIVLKIDVTSRSKELLRDCLMPKFRHDVNRCEVFIVLKMDVTSHNNDLFRDGVVVIYCHLSKLSVGQAPGLGHLPSKYVLDW